MISKKRWHVPSNTSNCCTIWDLHIYDFIHKYTHSNLLLQIWQYVRVRFAGFGKEEDEWVSVTKAVRERSIPLEHSECNKVNVGDLVLCFRVPPYISLLTAILLSYLSTSNMLTFLLHWSPGIWGSCTLLRCTCYGNREEGAWQQQLHVCFCSSLGPRQSWGLNISSALSYFVLNWWCDRFTSETLRQILLMHFYDLLLKTVSSSWIQGKVTAEKLCYRPNKSSPKQSENHKLVAPLQPASMPSLLQFWGFEIEHSKDRVIK